MIPSAAARTTVRGQPWVGFTLDFRDRMMAKHGAAQGKEVAEAVTIAPYDRAPASMPQGMTEIFIQDDDDANLQNGTPNFKQLAEAADAHSFPRPPDPPFVVIQHPPLPDTRDTVNPYPVFAMPTSAGGTVNAAWIVARAGQSAPTSIALTAQSSGVWTAFLPAVPAVTHVRYWIEARDHLGHRGRWPELGESTFTVGQRKVVFADDFERDRGWIGAHTAWSGRFERVDPIAFTLAQGSISLAVQPEDDHTAGRRHALLRDPERTSLSEHRARPVRRGPRLHRDPVAGRGSLGGRGGERAGGALPAGSSPSTTARTRSRPRSPWTTARSGRPSIRSRGSPTSGWWRRCPSRAPTPAPPGSGFAPRTTRTTR